MSRAAEVARSATVWVWSPGAGEPWFPLELDGEAFELSAGALASDGLRFQPLPQGDLLPAGTSASLLVRAAEESGDAWCLLSSTVGVRVNGDRLLAGVRLLQNRDEILLPGGARCYFSTERVPRPERFSGAKSVPCARCGLAIAEGELAVRCPASSCVRWHHHVASQDSESVEAARARSCWCADDTCAGCRRQPTALDVDRRWTPEE